MDNEFDVSEWVRVSREDFNVASLLGDVPYLAPACYHCQQSAEKILKAYLIAKESKLTKTHELDELVKQCEKYSPDFGNFKNACAELTQYATATRYPPTTELTEFMMKQAIKYAGKILNFTESKLKELGK